MSMLKLRSTVTMFASRALVSPKFTREFSNNGGRLEGKIALITGAASGIGKTTARKFVENGAKVVVADIQDQLGQQVVNELGSNTCYIHCDVTQESNISNAVDFTVATHGRLDIMYNNAGISCRTARSIKDLDLTAFDKVMSINVRGVIAGIKHAARVMIPFQKGSILCTSSVTGIMGGLAQPTYSISKSAIIGIVKSISPELNANGIRVNCISPYGIPTPFALQELRTMCPNVGDEELAKMLHDTGELKGVNCDEGDIANAALYLASDEAKYVSGHNLVVDGGFTAFKRLNLRLPDQVL